MASSVGDSTGPDRLLPFDDSSGDGTAYYAGRPLQAIALPAGAKVRDFAVSDATIVILDDGTTLSWGSASGRLSSLMSPILIHDPSPSRASPRRSTPTATTSAWPSKGSAIAGNTARYRRRS